MFIIYLFLIVLLIRPQDWVPLLLNLPTHYILIPIGFVIGYIRRPQLAELLSLPQSKLVLIYLLVVFLSTFLNAGVDAGFQQLNLFFKRSLIYFLVLLLIDSEEKLRKAVLFLLLIIVLLGTQAIQQAITGVGWGIATPYPGYDVVRVRWIGDWDGPNVFGLLLAMGVTMLFEVFLSYKKCLYRILSVAGLSILLPALFFTNSRGAFLALICTVFLQLFLRMERKSIAIIVATIFFGCLFAFSPSRMKEINSGESSAHERVYLWEQGLGMLRNNPLFGIGKGQFIVHSYSHLRSHNNYVNAFAETGLLGFFSWMGILWFSFQRMLLVINEFVSVSTEQKTLIRILFYGFLTYCAATFFVVMENDLLFFLFGLIGSSLSIIYKESGSTYLKIVGMKDILGIGICIFGVLFTVWIAAVLRVI